MIGRSQDGDGRSLPRVSRVPPDGTDRPARGRVGYDAAALLQVAVEVFRVRGYDGSSISELARAAGISKAAIYHHFSGKEEILRAAVTRALDRLFLVLEERGAIDGPVGDRVAHVVRRTTAVLIEELPYVTVLLRVRGNTATERWAIGKRREFDRRVAAMVSEAAIAGELRQDLDPQLATRLIFGMVNSLIEWYRPTPGESPQAFSDVVAELAMGGLRRGRSVL